MVTAASSTIGNLKKIGNQSCQESPDCTKYAWDYDYDEKEEVMHQSRFQAITDGSNYGNIEVTAQVNAEVAISFLATIGPDPNDPPEDGYSWISPRDPPSKTGSNKGSTPYVSRDEVEAYMNSDLSSKSDVPRPNEMDAETAEKYGVEKLEQPKEITVDGEQKRVTHTVKNFPIHTFGLQPRASR